MPSLILVLAWTVAAAWLATRPMGGAWLTQVLQAGPMLGPAGLSGGWTMIFLSQALAAWFAWRSAGRHAVPMLMAVAVQLALWVAWPWALLDAHRPGWALGVLTLSLPLQVFLLFRARSLDTGSVLAMVPAAAWLALLWWVNHAWWLASGGGLGSLLG